MTTSLLPNPDYDRDALVGQLGSLYDTLEVLMKNLDHGIQQIGDPSQGMQDYAEPHAHEFIARMTEGLTNVATRLHNLQPYTQHGPRFSPAKEPAILAGNGDKREISVEVDPDGHAMLLAFDGDDLVWSTGATVPAFIEWAGSVTRG